ncbi:MAG: 4-hydroxy-tetrahydrodipicolinate reductase [Patescibacteria group bacterium]
MKIALIGFGKMGQAIEQVALARRHQVVAKIDPAFAEAAAGRPDLFTEISAKSLNGAQVAIDFTHPQVVLQNLQKLTKLKIPTVVGTTGWYEKLPEVKKFVAKNSGSVLYAGNFSVGVQAFYKIVADAAQILFGKNFDVAIHETHHTGKADAPSGTAKEIAVLILKNFPSKKAILLDNAEQPVPANKLQISASRVGKIFGIHEVTFDGSSDSIQLIHTSKNRDALASGAVAGAEWLVAKERKGLFEARDWLGF